MLKQTQPGTDGLFSFATLFFQRWLGFIGLFLGFFSLFVIGAKNPEILSRINNSVTDFQISLLPKPKPSLVPVIVEVDERSLALYGQWPWPRYQVARLLETIQKLGASAIAIDAVFVERDRTSPVVIHQALARDFNQQLPITAIAEPLRDFDKILGLTLNKGPFVTSYVFSFSNEEANVCQPKSTTGWWYSPAGIDKAPDLAHPNHIICNIPTLQDADSVAGFINTAADSDGLYRKTPLIIEYQGRLYPSLALQAYLTANAVDHFVLTSNNTDLALHIGDTSVPLDNAGNLQIRFPSEQDAFKSISAADLLSGQNLPTLTGNIVFVGFSATGLHEFRPTPNAAQLLGVQFHAAIVDNLQRKDFFSRPYLAQSFEWFFAVVIGFILFIVLRHTGLLLSIILPSTLIVLMMGLSQWLLASTGLIVSPALPLLIVTFVFLVSALTKYAGEYFRALQMGRQVALSQDGIIGSFCTMSECRDPETGAHIKRTQEYIKVLAQKLQSHPHFKQQLNNETIELLFKAAPLHDLGKIGIRDNILLKDDKLSDIEFNIMKTHPQIGADMIASVANQIGWNDFMQIAYDICYYHQEKWDGSGYPKGLTGENIPLPARLMALADVYDALISKRVYKPAFSHNKAVSLICASKDKHFDPLIIEAFEAIHNQFRDIALRFLDSDEQKQTLLAEN